MIIIRKAKISDLKVVLSLYLKQHAYHKQLDPFNRYEKDSKSIFSKYIRGNIYSPKYILLVAEDKEKIVGFASALIKRKPPLFRSEKMGHIIDVHVVPRYRKKGVARDLLCSIYEWFESKKISEIELSVLANNSLGKKTWSKLGFKEFKITMRKSI